MNSNKISKLSKAPLLKSAVALCVTIVLLSTILTACATTQKVNSQKNSLHQQTLTQSDNSQIIDHTIVFDTIHIISNETIWREPDTLGNIYPLKTTHRQTQASRQTQNNIEKQTHDTIYIQTATTTTENQSTNIRSPTATSQALPWLIILGIIILAITILAIRISLNK